jgi:hypothetical protein
MGPIHRTINLILATALATSESEAVAQQSTEDTSANAYFLGCKAFVEGRTVNAKLIADGNFCSGVVHGLASVGEYLSPPEWQSCVPAASDARQLARVVVNYIEAHPQRMHEDFRRLTLEAFHYAWPCKSGR